MHAALTGCPLDRLSVLLDGLLDGTDIVLKHAHFLNKFPLLVQLFLTSSQGLLRLNQLLPKHLVF